MKIVIHCETGYCGTNSWNFVDVADGTTVEELDALAYEYALDNAGSYGYYPLSDDMDDEEASSDDVSDNIEGVWYLYDSEKHDMYSMSGTPDWGVL